MDKLELINQTDLTLVQVENWFINARRRILQKMLTKGNKYERKVLRAQGEGRANSVGFFVKRTWVSFSFCRRQFR